MVEALPPSGRRQLEAFEDLLLERAVPLGMVSTADRGKLWERHILDSIRGLVCFPEGTRRVVDIGSGGGLPGIPVAICRPDVSVVLLEPKSLRAGFLELVVERLNLSNVRVRVGRAEAVSLHADLCLARAVASPAKAWQLAMRIVAPDGRLLAWAGRSWPGKDEIRLGRLGARWKICAPPQFPWQGPLVIIGGT